MGGLKRLVAVLPPDALDREWFTPETDPLPVLAKAALSARKDPRSTALMELALRHRAV